MRDITSHKCMSLKIVHFSSGYLRRRVCPRRAGVYIPDERSGISLLCSNIGTPNRHTLTDRYIRRSLADSQAGIIISSAPLGDRYRHEEGERDVWALFINEDGRSWRDKEGEQTERETRKKETERERGVQDIRYRWEREYRVLQTSRQLPASGYTVSGINMRLTEWDRCFCCRVNCWAGHITSRQPYVPRPIVGPDRVLSLFPYTASICHIAELLNYSLYIFYVE